MSESFHIAALVEEITAESPAGDGTSLLTGALAKGEDEAWRLFDDRYRRRLRAYLATIWHGPDEGVDDLVQETFLRAVKHMRVFANEEALWSWLTVLARSATADAGRKRGRLRRFLQCFVRERRRLEVGEKLGVDGAIARLPEAQAKLLKMKYEEECRVRDIAVRLGISEKAVESRLTRARAMLKKELERCR
ncbi:MAG: sigma-70 family RNA polymerase sigma factor [Verrucomicrobiota bacterium]